MAEDPFKGLKVSQDTKDILTRIAAEVNAAYRENFEAMLKSLQDLAEGQKRLQATLGVLVKAIEPKLEKDLPVAVAIAMPEQAPDVASALVLANPAAAGFTLTQGQLAAATGLAQAEVSVLTRAFRLDEDQLFAVKVPRGKQPVVWYRPEAAARLKELIHAPPVPLSDVAQASVLRARKKLAAKEAKTSSGST